MNRDLFEKIQNDASRELLHLYRLLSGHVGWKNPHNTSHFDIDSLIFSRYRLQFHSRSPLSKVENSIKKLDPFSRKIVFHTNRAHLFGELKRDLAMISRITKFTEQDSDRQDDPSTSDTTGTKAKDDEIGTNQTLRGPEVPKKVSGTRDDADKEDSLTFSESLDRAALENAQTRHTHAKAHDERVTLGPSNNRHLACPQYFPPKYPLPPHSSHHYCKPYRYHRNRSYYYHYHHHHRRYIRYPQPLTHAATNHKSMAPFDDTTLATRNISSMTKNKSKAGNRSLTVDTTQGGRSNMAHYDGRHSRPNTPAFYPPNHGEYDHRTGSFYEQGFNRRQEQHFKFYEDDSAMEFEREYTYSTTPIAINTNTPQRSNVSSAVEDRNRNKGNGEHHIYSNGNNAVRGDRYHTKWDNTHTRSNYYHQPPRYHHGSYFPFHGVDLEQDDRTPSKTTSSGKSVSAKPTPTPCHSSQWDRRLSFDHPAYYHSGWYSPPYEYPRHDFPPEEPFDRHYFSPSPPPPPPSPYPDYYTPSSDSVTVRAESPPCWYEGVRVSYDEHEDSRRTPMPQYSSHESGYYHPYPPARREEEEVRSRPGTPSSNQSVNLIHEVTPGKTNGRISPNPSDLDPKGNESLSSSADPNPVVTPGDKKRASVFAPSSPFVTLRDIDIVCGRGAPTNFHIGNSRFRELVFSYHRSYFVAKRSDKPRIAMKILDILASRGARFVRRIKGGSSAASHWEEVASKIAYEKVCQALRDAGDAPRQMLSSAAASELKRKASVKPSLAGGRQEMSNPEKMDDSSLDKRVDLPLGHQPGGTSIETDEGKENDATDSY